MISRQQDVLMMETCPQMPEPAGCTVGVLSWWEKIAKIIFSELAAGYVCYGMNQECDVPTPRYVISNPCVHCPSIYPSINATNNLNHRAFDCDICKADAKAYLDYMAQEKQADDIVFGLSSFPFCEDPNLGLNEEQVEACKSFIAAFMPAALKTLFVDFPPTPEGLCQHYFGQCTKRVWWK